VSLGLSNKGGFAAISVWIWALLHLMWLVLNVLADPHWGFGSTQRDNYLTLRTVSELAIALSGLLLNCLEDNCLISDLESGGTTR
jgi:hypothetical protein